MVIERFRDGNPKPVYERFQLQGRLAADGLKYISSWVSEDLTTCYQVMETDEKNLLDEWIARWKDIVEFEVIPVITSSEASNKVSLLERA